MGSKAGTWSDFVEVWKLEREPGMVDKHQGRESLEGFVVLLERLEGLAQTDSLNTSHRLCEDDLGDSTTRQSIDLDGLKEYLP